MIKKSQKILFFVVFILMGIALYMVFLYAPKEKTMGDLQRIFYFHVPSAWTGFLAFLMTFVFSILYLKKRDIKYDTLANVSVKIGLIFCTIVLITGPLWARPAWGAWWTWDPRLTTTLILWFLYAGYLVIRGSVEDKEKMRRFCAVLGIVAFIDVPIVFFSIRLWRTIHPVVFTPKKVNIEPKMLFVLLFSLTVFTLLYVLLLTISYEIEVLLSKTARLKETFEEEIHGDNPA